MKKVPVKYDRKILFITAVLCCIGFVILFSASMGSLQNSSSLYSTLGIQLIGGILGFIGIYIAIHSKKIDYRCLYKKHYAVYLFLGAIILQLMVFSPLGIERNGANRWLDLGITTVQPSEFLKITMVLLLAALLVGNKKQLKYFSKTMTVALVTGGVVGLLMLAIRDKGTLLISGLACLVMFSVARIKAAHIIGMVLLAVVSLAGFIAVSSSESYTQDRLISYLGLESNPLGRDYQINQAVMTIGSGQIFGKGLGQSIQKHEYLPEPLTDSIYAVFSEEWGFIGSVVLVMLYLCFMYCALHIAQHSRDDYGRYVVIGLAVLIVAQSLFNVMALIKLVPLSGMPLVFISKGGTSLMASLCMVAIMLNVSRISMTGRRAATSRSK